MTRTNLLLLLVLLKEGDVFAFLFFGFIFGDFVDELQLFLGYDGCSIVHAPLCTLHLATLGTNFLKLQVARAGVK
jgi:hypothetical protein